MKYLFFILVFFNFTFAFEIPKGTQELSLNNHIYLYKDETNKKTIHEIKNKKNWTKNEKENYNLGYSDSTYWIKFDIKKIDEIEYFLSYKFVLIDILDVHFLKDKKIYKTYKTGLKRDIYQKAIKHRHYIFPLELKKDETIEVYIKLQSSLNSLQLPLYIQSKEFYKEHSIFDTVIMMVFFAIIILMLVYHVAIYFITKFSFYRYYLIYMVALIITSLYSSGFFALYIFPFALSDLMIILMQATGLLMILSLIYLIKSILKKDDEIQVAEKTIDYLFIVLLTIFILNNMILLFGLGGSAHLSFLMIILFLMILTGVSHLLISRILKKDVLSILLIFIWFPLILGLMMAVINQVIYFIDINKMEYILRVLFIYETLFISLVVAFRVREIEEEKKRKEIVYIRQSKLASMGEMINNISHQWKQPLARINSIIFNLDTLYNNDKLDKKTFTKKIDEIEKETYYMSDIISSFSEYFHPDKQQEIFNIYELIKDKDEYIKAVNEAVEINISCKDEGVCIKGFKKEYEQIIFVIIDNALDNFKEFDIKEPKINILLDIYKGKVRLIIENNGTKIKQEHLEQIFDPYFSTKYKTPNRGIGLYMAKMLIEKGMDKTLIVENMNSGVRFTILG